MIVHLDCFVVHALIYEDRDVGILGKSSSRYKMKMR